MYSFRFVKIFLVFSSLLTISIAFLRNYNSPKNIEKRCLLKFEKDFQNPLEASPEQWDKNLDYADNNYLKSMGMPQY